MKSYLIFLSLPFFHVFAAVVVPSRTVLETRITTTTFVIPVEHTSSTKVRGHDRWEAWEEDPFSFVIGKDNMERTQARDPHDSPSSNQRSRNSSGKLYNREDREKSPSNAVSPSKSTSFLGLPGSTTSNTHASTTTAPPTKDECFTDYGSCFAFFDWIQTVFSRTTRGKWEDPNDVRVDTLWYSLFCTGMQRHEANSPSAAYQTCFGCLVAAGQQPLVSGFTNRVDTLCPRGISATSLYDFIAGVDGLVPFLNGIRTPPQFNAVNQSIYEVLKLKPKFTRSITYSSATTSRGLPSGSTGGATTSFTSTTSDEATSMVLLPTEYLTQLPSNWPYTEFGNMGTATWTLTLPLNSSIPVAIVEAPLHWFPRPLGVKRDLLAGYSYRVAEESSMLDGAVRHTTIEGPQSTMTHTMTSNPVSSQGSAVSTGNAMNGAKFGAVPGR
ncbi:hypothetical protein P280DRAFT_554441 [Massarina eburnea CBS 473.64]|uniref:Uncharacterized protein n=1 Tax=Massarina eburnea CBS 473.64 TaxID=1395130 RepID=A0A6A6RHL8_9PLEO|nr:hypothetical protein P280DRAFT_554441 [Massarina eburnea CBS 473.64]